MVYEGYRSGSFLPLLTPLSGKERILISSASGSQSAYFISGSDISFSKFFWGQVANGSNVRNAFLHGKDAIKYACRGQTLQMDDKRNGTGNEKADGILARNYTISKVWTVITPHGYSSDPGSPVTNLPTLSLSPVGGGRWEGTYNGFSSGGTYEVAIHAVD